jgi:hypothetical protein
MEGGRRYTDLSAESLEARDEDVGAEKALHGLAAVDGELAAVEVLIDLGHLLVLLGAGRLVEVLDLAGVLGAPLPGKHKVEEAAEGDEDGGRREEQVVVGGEEARQIQREGDAGNLQVVD